MQPIKSPEEVRDSFRSQGLSVADWAREHGFTLPLVYAVLHGRSKALRGESHRIAVALGMKRHPKKDGLLARPKQFAARHHPRENAM